MDNPSGYPQFPQSLGQPFASLRVAHITHKHTTTIFFVFLKVKGFWGYINIGEFMLMRSYN